MNGSYTRGLDYLLTPLLSASTKCALVADTYTFDATAGYYVDVAGSVVATPLPLTSMAVVNGELLAADLTFTGVAAGDTIAAYVVYVDTGDATTSPVLGYVDTQADTTAISVVTDGGNVTLQFTDAKVLRLNPTP